jgi:hypothetical protein
MVVPIAGMIVAQLGHQAQLAVLGPGQSAPLRGTGSGRHQRATFGGGGATACASSRPAGERRA